MRKIKMAISKDTKVVVQDSKDSGKKKTFRKILVEGIAMYASVHSPKKAFDKTKPSQYSVDLIVSPEQEALLLAEGLKPTKVKVDEDNKKPKEYSTHPGLKVFTFSRSSIKKNRDTGESEPNTPPQVVDSQTVPIPSSILVGNGSKVILEINPYTYASGAGYHGGTKATLLAMQVLDLVEYVSENTTAFTKTTGFTLPNNGSTTVSISTQQDLDEDPFE